MVKSCKFQAYSLAGYQNNNILDITVYLKLQHLCLPEYLTLGKCKIFYTHISTNFNNKVVWGPVAKPAQQFGHAMQILNHYSLL